MRKIILILIASFLAFSLKAQDREVDLTPLQLDQSYKEYEGVAADTAGVSQSEVVFDLQVKSHVPVLHNIRVNITATDNGSGTFDVDLLGKTHPDESWTVIDNSTHTSLSGDQDLNFYSDLSSAIDTQKTDNNVFYRYFRVKIDGASLQSDDTYTLDTLRFKFYRR